MGPRPTKRIPALLIALAIAVALVFAGCGGGGDETSTPTSDSVRSTASQQGGGDSKGADQGSAATAQKPLDTSNLPEPTEGSKRAAPGVPTRGDTSIQTWGTEASASEREEATQTLRAFYDARAEANWAEACSHLAAQQKAELSRLVRASKSANAACAEAMAGLASQTPDSAFDREAHIGHALSLRIGKNYAFLIYTRSNDSKVYANALADEDGTWKVVSIGPTTLN